MKTDCKPIKPMKEIPDQLRKLRRQFLRYQQAEIVYSLSHKKLLELASDAGAIYRFDSTVLINREIFDGRYLKDNHPVRYTVLLLSGKLNGYLVEFDQQAKKQLELIVQQMAEREDVTEELKASDQMEWVRRMNNIRNRAEEVIKTTLIYH